MDEEKFVIEVGKEYKVDELFEYADEFLIVYKGEVIVCPCDDIDKETVIVEKIEELEIDEGDKIYLVWVR